MRVLAASLWLLAAPLLANPADVDGPLRLRNEFPYTQIFLSTPPLDARVPSRPRLDLGLTWANTYAVPPVTMATPAGHQWQHSPTPIVVDQASLSQTALARPTRNYYVADVESLALHLTYTHPLSRRALAEVELPVLGFGAGVLDGVISGYHSALGFDLADRHLSPKNEQQLFFARGRDQIAINSARGPMLGDVSGRVLYQAVRPRNRGWSLALSAAAKLPTGAARDLAGSGGVDGGLGVHVTGELGQLTLYGTSGVTVHSPWSGMESVPLKEAIDWHAGLSYRFTRSFALLGQISRYGTPFDDTGDHSIAEAATLYGVGGRFGQKNYQVEFNLIENIIRNNNTHDVGLYTKVRLLF